MAVVAVPFILYLVRFCSSKSCKKFSVRVLEQGVKKVRRSKYSYSYDESSYRVAADYSMCAGPLPFDRQTQNTRMFPQNN